MAEVVYVVDDCPQMQESIRLFLESIGIPVRLFSTAEEFLEHYLPSEDEVACVLIDLRLPGMHGLALQNQLASRGCNLPIIFITAFPETETAIEGMRKGAIDFLIKPFSRQRLADAIFQAFQRHREAKRHTDLRTRLHQLLQQLTFREQQILAALLSGKEAKQIAKQLSISVKTVLKHRLHILEKFGTSNPVLLVQMFWDAGVDPSSLAEHLPLSNLPPAASPPHLLERDVSSTKRKTLPTSEVELPVDGA